jgi:FO synthase
MRVQAPPNLVDLAETALLLRAGVDDWGGVSPLTPDHVNPERPWPQVEALARVTAESGFVLRERLTAHPPYLREPWLDPRLAAHVAALAGPTASPARASARPAAVAGARRRARVVRRTDLHASVDTTGRSADRRSDFDDVYGDWSAVREAVPVPVPRADSDVAAALRVARDRPQALTAAQALTLITADGADLGRRVRAGRRRAARHGRRRGHVRREPQRQLHQRLLHGLPLLRLRPAAHGRRRVHAVARRGVAAAAEAWDVGATEVCMQGGIDPSLPGTAYADLARAVKTAAPGLHLHAYSPMEVVNGAARSSLSIAEFLVSVREAGVDSLPGRRRRSSTTTSAGCSPRASCRRRPGWRSSRPPTGSASRRRAR